jgi:hypothetical protein
MKKLYTMILLAVVGWHTNIFAQGTTSTANNTTPTFETLKLNSSPAFVLLGVEPDNIQRPTTPSQFVAGLQNAVVNGKLQPNVAFEISPYYMVNPKDDKSQRFNPVYYMLDKKTVGQTIIRSLSISAATSTTDTTLFGKLKSGTGAGLGLHFLFIDGKPGPQLQRWYDAYTQALFLNKFYELAKHDAGTDFDINLTFDKAIDVLVNAMLPAHKFPPMSAKQLKTFTDKNKLNIIYGLKSAGSAQNKEAATAYLKTIMAKADTLSKAYLDSMNHSANPLAKQGFMLEFNAGQAIIFQDNTFDNATFAKTALWLTPSYRWDVAGTGNQVSLLDLMGVLRYTFNNRGAGVDVANYFDYGVKGAITQGRWSGSLEYVLRDASQKPVGEDKAYTYRLSAGLNYKLTDQITFSFNFGTNFDGNTVTYSDPKKMFAVGGLNFGLPSFTSTGSK